MAALLLDFCRCPGVVSVIEEAIPAGVNLGQGLSNVSVEGGGLCVSDLSNVGLRKGGGEGKLSTSNLFQRPGMAADAISGKEYFGPVCEKNSVEGVIMFGAFSSICRSSEP